MLVVFGGADVAATEISRDRFEDHQLTVVVIEVPFDLVEQRIVPLSVIRR